MNTLQKTGQKRTILISISIVLVSIHTIYFYHSLMPEFEVKKLIQQGVRFLLTIGLLFMIYKGKNWARILGVLLFAIAALTAIYSIFTVNTSLINKTPFMVMSFVYSVAVYHFYFSKSFKSFVEFQTQNK